MAARKSSTGSKSRKRRPSNARRKPKAVKHGSGRSKTDIKATIERAESEAPGFQRKPSWGHYSYLTALLGCVTKSAFSGFAAPENADEANVQIRTMAGVSATAANTASKTQIEKVLAGKATAKPPISDRDKLTELAATRAVADLG